MTKAPNKSKLEGQKLGLLSVLCRAEDKVRPTGKRRPVYLCVCDCGNFTAVESQTLRTAKSPHCGCQSFVRQSITRKGDKKSTKSQWAEYSSYQHMIGRCYDEKECGYENYGARGIQVCDSWRESFWNFIKDMGERPEDHVLDRIDPDGSYSPENCRWVDRNTSSFNTRKAKNNTSGRSGVYWFKRVEKWTAAIVYDRKQIHLGYFLNFEDAVKAREEAELKYYGELKSG